MSVSTASDDDYTASSKTTRLPPATISTKPQDHQDQCVWWCNELYGIIALAAVGTLLLISIFLCIVSCFLCKRRKCSKLEDVNGKELDTLGPCVASDLGGTFPLQEEPPTMKDVGISDVENCTLNSELPKEETPQDADDQTPDEAAANFPPPEDIPMLP